MPRRRYTITDDDVTVVHRWVHEKLRDTTWPRYGSSLTAWDMFPLDKPPAKKLQQWCDRFLDAAQWKQLQAVIRAARRDKSQYRMVRLSQKAHETLLQLAMREKLTLSETVERYLSDALKTPVVQDASVATSLAKPPRKRRQAKAVGDDNVIVAGPWQPRDPPPSKVMRVELWLRVENNNKFVRGRKKARESIEEFVLRPYGMSRSQMGGPEYTLSIPYETDEELDNTIYEILREAESTADYRHCFIEADVQSLDDPERSW